MGCLAAARRFSYSTSQYGCGDKRSRRKSMNARTFPGMWRSVDVDSVPFAVFNLDRA